MANGFGYTTPDSSVYFDMEDLEKAGHDYLRLEPWSRNNTSLLADGEGSLLNKTTIKRNEIDLALWKASKPGEPAWPSPWGPGWPAGISNVQQWQAINWCLRSILTLVVKILLTRTQRIS